MNIDFQQIRNVIDSSDNERQKELFDIQIVNPMTKSKYINISDKFSNCVSKVYTINDHYLLIETLRLEDEIIEGLSNLTNIGFEINFYNKFGSVTYNIPINGVKFIGSTDKILTYSRDDDMEKYLLFEIS